MKARGLVQALEFILIHTVQACAGGNTGTLLIPGTMNRGSTHAELCASRSEERPTHEMCTSKHLQMSRLLSPNPSSANCQQLLQP